MSLPDRTTVLVVGAGPTGLVSAISLIKQGIHDITIVDALPQGENTSRANVLHAATFEVCHCINFILALIMELFRPLTLSNVQNLSLSWVSKRR
jgi:2-polyprenyl-6-methoxyphenol hydroxylase-like FAD-dependent oxidoreductase